MFAFTALKSNRVIRRGWKNLRLSKTFFESTSWYMYHCVWRRVVSNVSCDKWHKELSYFIGSSCELYTRYLPEAFHFVRFPSEDPNLQSLYSVSACKKWRCAWPPFVVLCIVYWSLMTLEFSQAELLDGIYNSPVVLRTLDIIFNDCTSHWTAFSTRIPHFEKSVNALFTYNVMNNFGIWTK